MKKDSRVKAVISLDAVEHNFREMRKNIAEETKMIAVIKADAYGHGAVPVAHLIEDYDYIWGFAAATAEEAIHLREAGITKPILILGIVFDEYFPELVRYEIRPAVCEYEEARKLSDEAVLQKKTVHIHIALDTGMTRIGFADTQENVEEIKKISELPNLEIEGMFTHFARADEYDRSPAMVQLERYLDFSRRVEEAGVEIPLHHCSNSYGGTYVADRKLRVATVPVGYADGYSRQLSNKGWVLIHGQKAPILGRVCMDQFMVDVTEIGDVKKGDEVTLIGRDGDEFIGIEEIGDLCGRFSYEFACDISPRVPRVYIKNGKEI